MNKTILVIVLVLVIPGCGTMQTLNPTNDHVEISHRGKKSYCKKIFRVYSGTNYQVCKLNGEPSYAENLGSNVGGVPFFIIDIPLSFVMDTIVLPYTVTRQFKDGNISVN